MTTPQSDSWSRFKQSLRNQAIVLGGFVALIWTIELIDWFVFSGGLDRFGIRPRTVDGLWGIFFAPLLHGDFGHLFANTVPFLVLGWLILSTRRLGRFAAISLVIVLVSGLGTWIIGPRFSVHLGASGLVFGYFGFLLFIAYFERSFRTFAMAVFVFLYYGSMIWGVLPQDGGISWQAHLFGFLGGGVAAYLLGKFQVEDDVPITVHEPYEFDPYNP